jgi:CreA protein
MIPKSGNRFSEKIMLQQLIAPALRLDPAINSENFAMKKLCAVVSSLALAALLASPANGADEPDVIFKRSTVFKWLSPNHKLATYGLDDPEVDGVACHFTVPEKGGFKGWIGVAEEVSDISLACAQVGAIHFKAKFQQGEDVFRKRRSLFFKKMQIVRGCDAKRNVLVYMVYSDRIIEGSPKNSTSSVPIMPWGPSDQVQRCGDFVEK